jgi:hypothetical protein
MDACSQQSEPVHGEPDIQLREFGMATGLHAVERIQGLMGGKIQYVR